MGIISFAFKELSKYKAYKNRAKRNEEADIEQASKDGENDSERIAIKYEQID